MRWPLMWKYKHDMLIEKLSSEHHKLIELKEARVIKKERELGVLLEDFIIIRAQLDIESFSNVVCLRFTKELERYATKPHIITKLTTSLSHAINHHLKKVLNENKV